MKKLIAILLLAATLMLSSCGYPFVRKSIFPEGYTGGFGIEYGSGHEIYWVETYEECVEAMDQLKSHGSTFQKNIIFSYEGDLFDTKYCFMFLHKKDGVKYGDNPYDRWADKVVVLTVGFFEDVTIEELVYSDVYDYRGIRSSKVSYFDEICEKYSNVPSLKLEYKFYRDTTQHGYAHHVLSYEGEDWVYLFVDDDNDNNGEDSRLSQEYIDAILNSIVFIGFDD